MPSRVASWTGPSRSRRLMQRLTTPGVVLFGLEWGRDDRSVTGSPARYRSTHRLTVGQEHWNRAATSAIGTPLSTTS